MVPLLGLDEVNAEFVEDLLLRLGREHFPVWPVAVAVAVAAERTPETDLVQQQALLRGRPAHVVVEVSVTGTGQQRCPA